MLALTGLGLIGGWLILLGGGFHHQLHRYTREATFVDGGPALLMASLDFLMTALGVAALLQARRASRRSLLLGAGLVLVPPVLYVAAGAFRF